MRKPSLAARAFAALLLLAPLSLSPPVQRQAQAAQSNKPQGPLTRADLLAIATRLVEAGPRLAKLWPGYWPPDQPFIIYQKGSGALLISAGERPPSFKPLSDPDLPVSLKGRAFWHSGPLDDVQRPFVTGYPIGGGKTAILVDAGGGDAETLTTLLLHEQFHDYQARSFNGPVAVQFVDPLAIQDRVAFAASAEIERRILAKALATDDAAARKRLLQQYFALRRTREAAMPPGAVKVERGFELGEGTAKYVDRAGHAAIAGDTKGLKPLLMAELRKPLASPTGAFATHWFRSRAYGTGAAIAFLISRQDRGNWRLKIERGAFPDQLLESLVGRVAPADASRLTASARSSFGYQAIVREIGPVIRAGEKAEIKSADEFLARAPYRLVLDPKGAGEGSSGFNASNMAQLGPSTMALPAAAMFNYSAPGVSLSARELPVLIDGGRYTLLLSSAPEIVGLRSPAAGEHRLDSATIRTGSIDLRIDHPVIVTISEAATTIRLAHQKGQPFR